MPPETDLEMAWSAVDHGKFAKALRGRGDVAGASAHLEIAIKLAPHYAEAHMILADIAAENGEWDRAAVHCGEAANILPDSGDVRRHLTQCLRDARFDQPPAALSAAVLRCLRDPALDAEEVSGLAIRILLRDAEPLENPLLFEVLQLTVVADPDFELYLTRLRREMLLQNRHGSAWVAMALQCLNNEHIWAATPEEEAAFPDADAVRFLMYAPFRDLPSHLRSALPEPLRKRLNEEMEEMAIAAHFQNTPRPDISSKVRQLYEENPFPRWFSTTILPSMSLGQLIRLQLPGFSPPDIYDGAPRILLAGCGTGRETITLARTLPAARVTALDISSASLSYAMRMARQYDASNIEFVQMDLRDVAGLGREFDFVQCSGVLVTLPDPMAGWEALLSVLKPGGMMRIGLYSEMARVHIVSAQKRAAASGSCMRAFRQEILRNRESDEARELLRWPEFYSASGCRDLLFHVNERRSTIPEIARFLDSQKLRLTGFLFRDSRVLQRYQSMFPTESATDLQAWHSFESQNPETFRHLYCFYCQKT